MRKIVPLVSSSVTGPIEIVHLPRLWLKTLLFHAGALPEGYWAGTRGFDETLLQALGITPEQWLAYLKTRPNYFEVEAWVRDNAPNYNPQSVAAVNEEILNRQKSDEGAARDRATVGLTGSLRHGISLNDLDDWHWAHLDVVALKGTSTKMVPGISSSSAGPLGAKHLPRLWMKGILHAAGLLPEDWNTGPSRGLDKFFYADYGLDPETTIAYLATLPTYLHFEAFVRENAKNLSAESIETANATLMGRTKPAEKAARECAEVGCPVAGFNSAVRINDFLDWHELHKELAAAAPA